MYLLAAPALVAISKRKEARRRTAAANEFSKKYPLVEDPTQMAGLISQAEIELKTFKGTPVAGTPAKRVKKRNVDTLGAWLNTMKEHNKDLMLTQNTQEAMTTKLPTGGNLTTTEGLPPGAMNLAPTMSTAAPSTDSGSAPVPETSTSQDGSTTPKKGMNWLLIGGVVVVAFIAYKMFKK